MSRGATTTRDLTLLDWICDGIGLVNSEQSAALTGQATRIVLTGRDGTPTTADSLPPVPGDAATASDDASTGAPASDDVDSLGLTRVGRARGTNDADEGTIAPLWLPTDPPLLLVLITWVLRQIDFLSNQFSPFFGSSGVAFLAFGLAWDMLTIGAWANHATPGLPRTSRIFLYLGYTLLSVTVVNWALSVHDLTSLSRLTGSAGIDGL